MPSTSAKIFGQGTTVVIVVVALALLLAAAGMVLAVRQSHLLAEQRILEAQADAETFARDVARQVSERVTEALARTSEACRANPKYVFLNIDPMDGVRRPSWLGDLSYLDQSDRWRFWPGPLSADPEERRDTASHGRLAEFVHGRLRTPLALVQVVPPTRQAILQAAELDGRAIIIAHSIDVEDESNPFIIAASLDLQRLRDSFVVPLLSPVSERIHLVDAGIESPAWSEPLSQAMIFWELQPKAEFVQEARRAVRLQTVIFVGTTTLALVALLGVVWVLYHVVQREIAVSEVKGSFVADVSHELKTPLALIRMFGETLSEGRVKSQEKRQEYYQIITRESTRLTHLINNILDFSRINAGKKDYKLELTDVGQVVRTTYESYRFDLEHNHFEHHLLVQSDLPQIHADADAISQAVLNLLGNAMKYHDGEKFISVEVTPETRRGRHGVLISVRDRGIGIKPEVRRRLFEGFYRAADDRVRKRRGVGLGLALVKHIIDAHGGSIDVESRLVKGSTFRLFLPQNTNQEE